MSQRKQVSEPFGEVNVSRGAPGKLLVRATLLLEPHKEGARTGIALDGSGSMSAAYGQAGSGGNVFGSFFGRTKGPPTNQITPIARKLCAYLARKMDAQGGTASICWATGPGGTQVEPVGDFTAAQAEQYFFAPPAQFGTGTQLLPALKHFTERFKDAPFGFYVFITDGEMHDLEEVKAYSRQLAKEIVEGKRPPVKFVLVGVGDRANEEQMTELDDLDTGTGIDLWGHKITSQMRYLEDTFAEVVDRNARIAPCGRVLDPKGVVVKDYSSSGVPAELEFEIADTAPYFTLEIPGHPRAHQALKEDAELPPASTELVSDSLSPSTEVTGVPEPAPVPPAMPQAASPSASAATPGHPSQAAADQQFLEAITRILAEQHRTIPPTTQL